MAILFDAYVDLFIVEDVGERIWNTIDIRGFHVEWFPILLPIPFFWLWLEFLSLSRLSLLNMPLKFCRSLPHLKILMIDASLWLPAANGLLSIQNYMEDKFKSTLHGKNSRQAIDWSSCWKTKFPPRILMFGWRLAMNMLPKTDVLAKKKKFWVILIAPSACISMKLCGTSLLTVLLLLLFGFKCLEFSRLIFASCLFLLSFIMSLDGRLAFLYLMVLSYSKSWFSVITSGIWGIRLNSKRTFYLLTALSLPWNINMISTIVDWQFLVLMLLTINYFDWLHIVLSLHLQLGFHCWC